MTITFKALAALLAYPSDDLVAALPEIVEILEDADMVFVTAGLVLMAWVYGSEWILRWVSI